MNIRYNLQNLRECPDCGWWQIKPKKQNDVCENPNCGSYVDFSTAINSLIWRKRES